MRNMNCKCVTVTSDKGEAMVNFHISGISLCGVILYGTGILQDVVMIEYWV